VTLYAALVFVLSVVPAGPGVSVPYLDKLAHVCEYLLFAWLLVKAVSASQVQVTPPPGGGDGEARGGPVRQDSAYLLWVWIFATSYGLLLEIVQRILPWRSADVTDAAMNALGAALGVAIGQKMAPPSP